MTISKSIKSIILTAIIMPCLPAIASTSTTVTNQIAAIEASYQGRLGVSAVNTNTNEHIQYRANERFPFCSTSKVMAVAAILKRDMNDKHLLNKHINYESDKLLEHSPITEKNIKNGMTISELSEATLTTSDNTAMNLLLRELGGPASVTTFARSIGDTQFRLDRWEPDLNSSIPGDKRDTTTPAAMEKSLSSLLLGHALAAPQRHQLLEWLKSNTTGDTRIRAGVPNRWIVGDKTGGSSDYGSTNDIGIIYPPHCQPIVVAIYFTQPNKDAERKDEVIAKVTRLIVDKFAESDACLKNTMRQAKNSSS